MRVIRNAIVQFGLVNVPVGLASVASEQKVEFRLLHRDCSTPLNQSLRCAKCEKEVPTEDRVRGFEHAKDQFVTFEEDELDDLLADRDPVIELSKFIPAEELDPILVQKTYYLLAPKVLHQSYEVLEAAMTKTGLVGIAKSSLWGKESPAAITAEAGILRLHLLWCADEIASIAGATDNLLGNVNEKEIALAENVLRAMRSDLTPEDLVSTSRSKLSAYVQERLEGKTRERQTEDGEKLLATTDLIGTLRASVEAARKTTSKTTAGKKKTTTARPKKATAARSK